MTNLHVLPSPQAQSVESKLIRMRELDDMKKIIDAEFQMIKSELTSTYFATNQEYRTDRGLLLATYTGHVESRFDSKAFKADFPEEYEGYKKQAVVFKFLLKK